MTFFYFLEKDVSLIFW